MPEYGLIVPATTMTLPAFTPEENETENDEFPVLLKLLPVCWTTLMDIRRHHAARSARERTEHFGFQSFMDLH